MVLAGGDAGLRLGEIIALEWRDIELPARRLEHFGDILDTRAGAQ